MLRTLIFNEVITFCLQVRLLWSNFTIAVRQSLRITKNYGTRVLPDYCSADR